MENRFGYTTIDQQIQKLKSQHLIFENENLARNRLATYGYYNIINGYREPYIVREYDKKTYSPNVTFEQIFALFSIDHRIRNAILLSMIDLEEHLKAITAEVIAESFGTDYVTYLAKNNYRDKKVRDPKFNRNNILGSMLKVAQTSTIQPIKYYRETHGYVPPWILFKGIYFGTFVNFIRFLKGSERDKLIRNLYLDKVNDSNLDYYKDLLYDTIFLCHEYRNLAAHGGRTYNYIPSHNVRAGEELKIQKGLPLLHFVLGCFAYKQPHECLHEGISDALNYFCNTYSNDIHRIEAATGFSITREECVWINPKSQKFHRQQYCSGAKNNIFIPYTDALSQGFKPCRKCIH